ncbi:MAG: glycerol kinase GlpK [Thermoplasmata archaeon]
MTKNYIVSIDVGTTGTRCIIFNENAKIVSKSYKKNKLIYPHPGWVEQDPFEIIENVNYVVKEAIKIAKAEMGDIISIGVTNQRESIVSWNKITGMPYYNIISWQDTRTNNICSNLIENDYEKLIKGKSGLSINTYFSAPKIEWLNENIEKFRTGIEKSEAYVGTIDSWVVWNLTGKIFATDYTNASRTMLMNLKKLNWDADLLDIFKIPENILPEIFPSSNRGYFGFTKKDGPFKENIPISGIIGDQQASLLGQACYEEGMVKNTYGTGSFILMNTGKEIKYSKHGLITTLAFGDGKNVSYALEGSIAYTGFVIEWLKDNLGLLDKVEESERLSSLAGSSDGVYFVPSFSGLYAPYWDMEARGLIIGLTSFTKKEHIIHAALESIGYQTRDVLDAMQKDIGKTITELRVDGGASENNYLLQLQSDILGIDVIRSGIFETTALGAAFSAGIAIDYFKKDLWNYYSIDEIFRPKISKQEREKAYSFWKKAVNRSKKWLKTVTP